MIEGPFRLWPASDPRGRREVGPPFNRLNAGWLAVDFVNTVYAWMPDSRRRAGRDWGDRVVGERIESYADLIAWTRVAELLEESEAERLAVVASRNSGEAERVVERARVLRASLYRLFRAGSWGWAPLDEDVERLNAERERARRKERVVPGPGRFELRWVSAEPELDAPIWPIVESAVALLTSPEMLSRVGQCDGDECGWLFVDTSRGRRRRWCDIRTCGNVAKVRAYRRRRRGSSAS